MCSLRAGLTVLAFSTLTATAHAGNDDSILLGNDAALTGGAVVATVSDGSALWYNPAGLARARSDSVDVGASAFALRKYNIPEFITADDGTRADASFTEVVTIPSAITYVRRFNERTTGGLALFASQLYDFTLRSSFDVTDPNPELQNLRFRIQSVSTSEIARYHLAGGVGIRLPRGFGVGVALFGDYGDFAQSSRLSADASVMSIPALLLVSTTLLQQKVLGFHVRAGLTYQPIEQLTLGLSIESPGVYFYRTARLSSLDGQTNLVNAETGTGPVLTTEPVELDESHVALGLYAPVRVRLGGAISIGGTTLALEGDLQSKLDDDELDVHRVAVFNVRAGAQVPVRENLRLGAGLFTDRGSDRKDAVGAGRVDFYGVALGGEYQTVRWLEGAGGDVAKRAPLTFSTTIALRYAYGFGKFPGVHLAMPSYDARDVASAIRVHELTLHIGSGLYF